MTTQVVMDAVGGAADEVAGKQSAVLVMLYGETIGRRFVLADRPVVMGRDESCDLPLLDTSVSRGHCRFSPRNGRVLIEDLGSTNHTYVNGERVEARLLADGDQLRIGRSIFNFLSGDHIERAYHDEIYRLMSTDSLTGAFNRQHFDRELERLIAHSGRYRRHMALAMLDIDHFKAINDRHGHVFGDRVLATLGAIVQRARRAQDVFCRYGGEQFALLLPETALPGALHIAERVRRHVAAARYDFDGKSQAVSVSIGLAPLGADDAPQSLVEAADARLYEAKRGGRDRVEPPA